MVYWLDRRAQNADTKADDAIVFEDKLISTLVLVLSCLAWASAMFVPAWKIVDTSYLFRVRYRSQNIVFLKFSYLMM
jgi:hypothetical protein